MLCRKKHIYMWEIGESCDGFHVSVLRTDYDALKDVVMICGGQVHIAKMCGLFAYLKRICAHRFFCTGFILNCILLYFFAQHIWVVEINGNSIYTDQMIIEYLNQIKAGAGSRKKDLKLEEIEEGLRSEYPEITWISSQITGTKLKINIVESVPRVNTQEIEKSEIRAPYTGQVKSIMLRSGTAHVKEGDMVKKGDLLVEGCIEVLNEDESVAKIVTVPADADIRMNVKFLVDKSYNRHYLKKCYVDQESKRYLLHVGDATIHLSGVNRMKSDVYDEEIHRKHFKLTKDFYLPFCIETIKYRAYIMKPAVYSEEEIKNKALCSLEKRITEKNQKDEKIVKKHLNFRMSADTLKVHGYIWAVVTCH